MRKEQVGKACVTILTEFWPYGKLARTVGRLCASFHAAEAAEEVGALEAFFEDVGDVGS